VEQNTTVAKAAASVNVSRDHERNGESGALQIAGSSIVVAGCVQAADDSGDT
jgi:hypothetical protein